MSSESKYLYLGSSDCRILLLGWSPAYKPPECTLDFGVGSSWLRGHPQAPESNSGGWLPATSDVIAQVSPALSYPEPLRVTGPLPSIVLRTEDMWWRHNQCHRSERGSQSGFPLLTPFAPFQEFARRCGIQFFRLYSTPSPVTENCNVDL